MVELVIKNQTKLLNSMEEAAIEIQMAEVMGDLDLKVDKCTIIDSGRVISKQELEIILCLKG